MQMLIDFFPLVAFFVSFKLGGIYVATGVLIAACAIQIAWHKWHTGTVKTLHWVTGLLVLVFGVATLIFRNPHFIQWKLTILMGVLAIAFLVSQFFGAKTLCQRFLESVLTDHISPTVTSRAWRLLNLAWVAFFAVVAAANLYIAYHYSQDVWVNFKAFGVMAMMFAFLLPQIIWLMPKHVPDNSNNS